ncbi:SgcJ/EcaC family oxidoreductase [Pseudorhodoplanes sp.]|uniref:YybH family protein n=1 Tax=Pseudorhodoplanes sp. TaxID=1934341 RepID=UPI002C3C0F84|nr:SgcJ/EcaC family oxidoreductase [Pseudorhodoplanes sp.]HWV40365.1 SgcJ/EcaC family oxidoreductase [Pseudorhodoplanes sp.]
MRGFVAALFAGLTLAPLPAAAQPSAEAEIRKTLAQWTEDFNARRADRVCDLFAKDLVAKFRGAPERGYARQCELLTSALADPKRRFHNALEIREILVFGDTAIVRVVWTQTIGDNDSGRESRTVEPGLDVLRRDADGRWRIIRYLAFAED